MAPLTQTYNLTEIFVPQDILAAELARRQSTPSADRARVVLMIADVSPSPEGELLEIQGQNAVMRSGQALQFVDLSRVVALRVLNPLP